MNRVSLKVLLAVAATAIVIASIILILNSNRRVDYEPEKSKYLQLESPPLGWNSNMSYGQYLYEEAAFRTLETFMKNYASSGYEFFIIHVGWFGEFELHPETMFPSEKNARDVNVNQYGLYQPSNTYFPNGFKPIIEKTHQFGLKFGLSILTGIPRKAVQKNLPIQNSNYCANDIADTSEIEYWGEYNYNVNTNLPGAQEYYNSLFQELSDWQVDLIKVIDINNELDELNAIIKANKALEHPMIISIGANYNDKFKKSLNKHQYINVLRVVDDLIDNQNSINDLLDIWKSLDKISTPDFWIDFGNLPIGQLQLMDPTTQDLQTQDKLNYSNSNFYFNHWSRYSIPQKQTLVTIYALAAVPIIIGGDLITMDDFSHKLLVNTDMIECNQNGVMGRQIFGNKSIKIWKTESESIMNEGWVGIFNTDYRQTNLEITNERLGLPSDPISLKDIWNNNSLDIHEFVTIPPYGVIFIKYKL